MNSFQMLLQQQQRYFHEGHSKSVSYRIEALRKLRLAIKQFEPNIIEALKADLNKSELEAYSTEIGIVLEEINITLKNIKRWSKPKRVKTPLTHLGSSSYMYAQPYGIVLIIAPWNYPFQLAISPLIGAIAAGNVAVIKPSELAPRTSSVISQLIASVFSKEQVAVVEGGIDVNQALLAERWDYIFFTGSVPVGKIVMEAAAKHLTPVTLELGGKSPCVVHKDAHIQLAAKRIAWGKYLNAGQTCIAPDYVYVHQDVRDEFVSAFREAVQQLYSENVLQGEHYTRIVSPRHFQRLISFLEDGRIVMGGKYDEARLQIEPTLMEELTWESPIMKDEIFGPILPMMTYDELNDVIVGIRQHPNPLALYLFSESKDVQQHMIEQVSFGGGCINDTIFHVANPYLPFGGVGTSGIGSYHGKFSFDVFTHYKSVLKQTTRFDLPFRYPNMKNAMKIIKMLLK